MQTGSQDRGRCRAECATALQRIGPVPGSVPVVPELLGVLSSTKHDVKVRERVMWALRVHGENLFHVFLPGRVGAQRRPPVVAILQAVIAPHQNRLVQVANLGGEQPDEMAEIPALQRQAVPSKLIVFPDEGHWITKPQNSIVWYREVLGWLGQYLR